MIIRIGQDQKVVAEIYGDAMKNFTEDGVTIFKVADVPAREAGKTLHYDPEKKEFYIKDIDAAVIAARQVKAEAQQKKAAAMKWLADNDWKVNKHTLGEWAEDDPRWLEYLAGREQARADYDVAEAILNN